MTEQIERAPRNCYWRGGVLWARIRINGVEHRWSLRTSDKWVAIERLAIRAQSILNSSTHRARAMTKKASVKNGAPTVYFVARSGYVKIGFSSQLETRLTTIQTASPEPIAVLFTRPGDQIDEQKLHERFAEYRTVGEWFHLEGSLLNYVRARCQSRQALRLAMRDLNKKSRTPSPTPG